MNYGYWFFFKWLKPLDIFRIRSNDDGVNYSSDTLRSITVVIDLIVSYIVAFGVGFVMFNSFGMTVVPEYFVNVRFDSTEMTDVERIEIYKYLFFWCIQQIIQVIIIVAMLVYSWHRFGTTPGKFIFGLKVVDQETFENLTVKQGINVLYLFQYQFYHCF